MLLVTSLVAQISNDRLIETPLRIAVLLTLLSVLLLSGWLSRKTVATLNQLSGLTSEMPDKLQSDAARFEWPQTGIAETRLLITNFKVMAASLSALLSRERQIHERLDAEVAQRTAALSDSLREKDALLREVHHRVKNNLQVISSMLRLESARPGNQASRPVLEEMQSRVRSMALLHETIYRTGVFAAIDLGTYLQQIASQAVRALQSSPPRVQLQLALAPIEVDLDRATPCGLLANELLSNSLKHAFPEGRTGLIRVALQPLGDDRWRLSVADDGVGLPPDFDLQKQAGLGLQLAAGLAEQIGGRLDIGPGTEFSVTFVQTAPAAPRDAPRTGATRVPAPSRS